ncbi:DUF3037 domain-containing protein [Enterococcus faecalis]|uniref:DUF3037 domain-containing protein n=1 Tax=Enterococcus faecalis TaxID=1351 RepID=UPI00156D44F4|nr:DUF3037 domain-containing protein [Enterococcus faecalis]EGO7801133.1 DUF3037 domain-containing protein [Enterococcus faecalis]MBO1105860.1 DUF3037 domain-containing protein [Enterococcus faecalis]NSN06743.1 DUF3037 domain-containing protein [Enterococcus faecalis]NSU14940.1 DUF3037 domain-containing protein [Enterococcus faecalis]HBI1901279.1 DUF3037 domain-containing protein [Enterococcus faecalis]
MRLVNLYYAVCQYIPDEIRSECMNIGIVVHIPDKGYEYSEFIPIKNRRRLQAFDDEYNEEFINLMFDHMKYQFNYGNSLDYEDYGVDEFGEINSDTFLDQKIKYYVNEFRFLPVQKLETDTNELKSTIKDLFRTYLYYDIPKNNRITRSEVKKLLNKQISSLRLNKFVTKGDSINMIKDFDDHPIFDVAYKNTYVRTFSFDYANKVQISKELKILLYDIEAYASKLEGKNVVLVMNDFDKDEHYYKKYLSLIEDVKNRTGINIVINTLPEYATFLLKFGIEKTP